MDSTKPPPAKIVFKGPYVERIGPSSPEAVQLLEKINVTNVDPEFRDRYWRIAAVYSVSNEKLRRTYDAFKKELTASGRLSEPPNDVLVFSNETRKSVQDICRNGCRSSGRKGRVLGDAGSGVHLVRHYDILSRFLAYRQRGAPCFIMIQKAVLGKTKPIVPRDAKGDSVAPYPGFDCHVSASRVQPKEPIINAFKCSQVFFYEHAAAEASATVDYPRQILPYAVIELDKKHPIRLESPFLAVGSRQSLWEVKGETRRGFRFVLSKVKDRTNKRPITRKRKMESIKTNLKDQLLEMRTRWPEPCTASKVARVHTDSGGGHSVDCVETRKMREKDITRNKGPACAGRTRFNRAAKPLPLSLKPYVSLHRLPPAKDGSRVVNIAAVPKYQGTTRCGSNSVGKDVLIHDDAGIPKLTDVQETKTLECIGPLLTGNCLSDNHTVKQNENGIGKEVKRQHSTDDKGDSDEGKKCVTLPQSNKEDSMKLRTLECVSVKPILDTREVMENFRAVSKEDLKKLCMDAVPSEPSTAPVNKSKQDVPDSVSSEMPGNVDKTVRIGEIDCTRTKETHQDNNTLDTTNVSNSPDDRLLSHNQDKPLNTKENDKQASLQTPSESKISDKPMNKGIENKTHESASFSTSELVSIQHADVMQNTLDNAAKTQPLRENRDNRAKVGSDKDLSFFKPFLRASHSRPLSIEETKTKVNEQLTKTQSSKCRQEQSGKHSETSTAANIQAQVPMNISEHTVETSKSFVMKQSKAPKHSSNPELTNPHEIDIVLADRKPKPCYKNSSDVNSSIKHSQESSKNKSMIVDTKTSFFKPFLKASQSLPSTKMAFQNVPVPQNSEICGTNKSGTAICCNMNKIHNNQTLHVEPQTKKTAKEDSNESNVETRTGVDTNKNEVPNIVQHQRTVDSPQNTPRTSVPVIVKQSPMPCISKNAGLTQATCVDVILPNRVALQTPVSGEVGNMKERRQERSQNMSKTDGTSFFKPFLKTIPQVGKSNDLNKESSRQTTTRTEIPLTSSTTKGAVQNSETLAVTHIHNNVDSKSGSSKNIDCNSVSSKVQEKISNHEHVPKVSEENASTAPLPNLCTQSPSTSTLQSPIPMLNTSKSNTNENTSYFKTFLNASREDTAQLPMDLSAKKVSTETSKNQKCNREQPTVSHKMVHNVPSSSPPIADTAPTTLDTNPMVCTAKTSEISVSVPVSVGNDYNITMMSQPTSGISEASVPSSSGSTGTRCLVFHEDPPRETRAAQTGGAQLVNSVSETPDNETQALFRGSSKQDSSTVQKVHPPFTREFFETQQASLTRNTPPHSLKSTSSQLSMTNVTAENPNMISVSSADAFSSAVKTTLSSSVSSDTQTTDTKCSDNPLTVLKSGVTVDENTAKRIQQFLFQQIALKTNKKPAQSEQSTETTPKTDEPKPSDDSRTALLQGTASNSSVALVKNEKTPTGETTVHTDASDTNLKSMTGTTGLEKAIGRTQGTTGSISRREKIPDLNGVNSSDTEPPNKSMEGKQGIPASIKNVSQSGVSDTVTKQSELRGQDKQKKQQGIPHPTKNNEGSCKISTALTNTENINKTSRNEKFSHSKSNNSTAATGPSSVIDPSGTGNVKTKKPTTCKIQQLKKTEQTSTQKHVNNGSNDIAKHDIKTDHKRSTNHRGNDKDLDRSSPRTKVERKVKTSPSMQTKPTELSNAKASPAADKANSHKEKFSAKNSESNISTSENKCLKGISNMHTRDANTTRTKETSLTTLHMNATRSSCTTDTQTKEQEGTDKRKEMTIDLQKMETPGVRNQNVNVDLNGKKEHKEQQEQHTSSTNDCKTGQEPTSSAPQNIRYPKPEQSPAAPKKPQEQSNASTRKIEDRERPSPVSSDIKSAESGNKKLNRHKTDTKNISTESNMTSSIKNITGCPIGTVQQGKAPGKANSKTSIVLTESDKTRSASRNVNNPNQQKPPHKDVESSIHAQSKTTPELMKQQGNAKPQSLIANEIKQTKPSTGHATQSERSLRAKSLPDEILNNPGGNMHSTQMSLSVNTKTHAFVGATSDQTKGGHVSEKATTATKLSLDTSNLTPDHINKIPEEDSVKDAWHSTSLKRNTKSSGHYKLPIEIKKEPGLRNAETFKSNPKTNVPTIAGPTKIPDQKGVSNTKKDTTAGQYKHTDGRVSELKTKQAPSDSQVSKEFNNTSHTTHTNICTSDVQTSKHSELSRNTGNTAVNTVQQKQSSTQSINSRDPRHSSNTSRTNDAIAQQPSPLLKKNSDNNICNTNARTRPIENKDANINSGNGDHIKKSNTNLTNQSITTVGTQIKTEHMFANNQHASDKSVAARNKTTDSCVQAKRVLESDSKTDRQQHSTHDESIKHRHDLKTMTKTPTNPHQPSIPHTPTTTSDSNVERKQVVHPVACTNYKALVGQRPLLQTNNEHVRNTNKQLDNSSQANPSINTTKTGKEQGADIHKTPALREPVCIKREPCEQLSDTVNKTSSPEHTTPTGSTEECLKEANIKTQTPDVVQKNSKPTKGLTQGQCKSAILHTLNELSEVLQFLKDSKKAKNPTDDNTGSNEDKECSDSRTETKPKIATEDTHEKVASSKAVDASTRHHKEDKTIQGCINNDTKKSGPLTPTRRSVSTTSNVSDKDLVKFKTTPASPEGSLTTMAIPKTNKPSVQNHHEENKIKQGPTNPDVRSIKPKPRSSNASAMKNIPHDKPTSSKSYTNGHQSDLPIRIKTEPIDTIPLESSTEPEKDHHQIPVLCRSNGNSSSVPPISGIQNDAPDVTLSLSHDMSSSELNSEIATMTSKVGHTKDSTQDVRQKSTEDGDQFTENSVVSRTETSQSIPVTFGNREMHTREFQWEDGQFSSIQQTRVHSGQRQASIHNIRHENEVNSPNNSASYTFHKNSEFDTSGNYKVMETCHRSYSTRHGSHGHSSDQHEIEACTYNPDHLNNNDGMQEDGACAQRSSSDIPINERMTQLSKRSYVQSSGDQSQTGLVQESQSISVQPNPSQDTHTSDHNRPSMGRKRPAPSDSEDEVLFSFHEVMRMKTVQYKKYRMGYSCNKFIDYNRIRSNEAPKPTNTRGGEGNVGLRAIKQEINNSDEGNTNGASRQGKRKQPKQVSRKKLKKKTISDADKPIPIISTHTKWLNARANQKFNKGGMGYFRWRNKYQSRPQPHQVDGDYFITKRGLRQTKDEFTRWTKFKERETIRKNIESALHEYKKTFRAEDARNVDEKVASYLKSLTEPFSTQEEEEMHSRGTINRRGQTDNVQALTRYDPMGRGIRNRRQRDEALPYGNAMTRGADFSNPLAGLLGGVLSANLIEGLLKQQVASNIGQFNGDIRDQLTRHLIGNMSNSSATDQRFRTANMNIHGRTDNRGGKWKYNEKLDRYVFVTDDMPDSLRDNGGGKHRHRSSSPRESNDEIPDRHRRDYKDKHNKAKHISRPRDKKEDRSDSSQKENDHRYRSSSPRDSNDKLPERHRRDYNDKQNQATHKSRPRDKKEDRSDSSHTENDVSQRRCDGSVGHNERRYRSRSREKDSNRSLYRNASPGSGNCEEYNGSWSSNNEDYSQWDHSANFRRRSLSRDLDYSAVDFKRQRSTSIGRDSNTYDGGKLASSWNDEKYHCAKLEPSRHNEDTFELPRHISDISQRKERNRRENDIDDRVHERIKAYRSDLAVSCDDIGSRDRYEDDDDIVQNDSFRSRHDTRSRVDRSQDGQSKRPGRSYNESERPKWSISDCDRDDYQTSRRDRDEVIQPYDDIREDSHPRSRDVLNHRFDTSSNRFRDSRRNDDIYQSHAYANKRKREFDEDTYRSHRRSYSNDDFDNPSDKSWEPVRDNRDDKRGRSARDRRDNDNDKPCGNRERDIIPFRTDRFRSSTSDNIDRRRRSSPMDETQPENEYSGWSRHNTSRRKSSTDRDTHDFDRHRDRTGQSPPRRRYDRGSGPIVFTDEFDPYEYGGEDTKRDDYGPSRHSERERYDRKRHNYYPPSRASATVTKPATPESFEEGECI